jgi:glycosyltransferase involved in cell wall biosynthesis
MPIYDISQEKTAIIENYYGERIESEIPLNKTFIGTTRNVVFKNLNTLADIFEDDEIIKEGVGLDLDISGSDQFIDRIKKSYAVILISIGDISPNMILEAIRCGKPFIVTKEIGIKERIKDIALLVDPMNKEEIKKKILWLCNDENYKNQLEKINSFTFVHSWKDIADELLNLKI